MFTFVVMKTYQDNNYRYFYDTNIRLWTIYKVDEEGNQVENEAYYFQNKKQMRQMYSFIKYTPLNETNERIATKKALKEMCNTKITFTK